MYFTVTAQQGGNPLFRHLFPPYLSLIHPGSNATLAKFISSVILGDSQ